jgi:hypothetical protein
MNLTEKYRKQIISRQSSDEGVTLAINDKDIPYDRDPDTGQYSTPLLPYEVFSDLKVLARKVVRASK